MNESFHASLQVGLWGLADTAVLLAILFLGRAFYRLTTPVKVSEEIAGRNNVALGVALSGYLVGLTVALGGGLLTVGDGPQKAFALAVLGLLAIVLMRLSLWINDRLILGKFSNLREIVQDRNLGVGFVEAGGCLATGTMLAGVNTGPAESVWEKVLNVTVYWAVGQILLVVGSRCFRWACFRSVDVELGRDNNAASGLAFGGFLAAVGLILHAAFRGVTGDWAPELVTVVVFFALGLLLLIAGGLIFNRFLLPQGQLAHEICQDQNSGAGVMAGVGFVCLGLLFSSAVEPATSQATWEPKAPVPAAADEPEQAPAGDAATQGAAR